jgi:hypothetical protein
MKDTRQNRLVPINPQLTLKIQTLHVLIVPLFKGHTTRAVLIDPQPETRPTLAQIVQIVEQHHIRVITSHTITT